MALAKAAVKKSKQMAKGLNYQINVVSIMYWLGLIAGTLALTELSEDLKSYSYSLKIRNYPVKPPVLLVTYVILSLVLIGSSKTTFFAFLGRRKRGWKTDSQTGKLEVSKVFKKSLDTNILQGLIFFGWFASAIWILLGLQLEAVLALNDMISDWSDCLILIVASVLVLLTHAFINLALSVQQIKSFGFPQTVKAAFRLWRRHLPSIMAVTIVYLFWDFVSLFTGLLLQIWLFPRKYIAYYALTENLLEWDTSPCLWGWAQNCAG